MVRTNETKARRLSIPLLKQCLDQVFSQYIRLKAANDNGFCRCVTCGTMWRWNAIQNGHYIKREHMGTWFDERNCHPCCYRCNVELGGNLENYKRYLIRTYGVKVLEELESAGRSLAKWTVFDYQEKIAYYKEEVKRLKKEKGL